MKKALNTLAIAFIAGFAFSGCGYDGVYRYPCQDPENWDAKECNPPLCRVDGTCWKDLIGFDPEEIQE
jgi:hypothetical protein